LYQIGLLARNRRIRWARVGRLIAARAKARASHCLDCDMIKPQSTAGL
jgi:hypothetical protein